MKKFHAHAYLKSKTKAYITVIQSINLIKHGGLTLKRQIKVSVLTSGELYR